MRALWAAVLCLIAGPAHALEPSGPRLVLETAYGDIVLGLYADAAPLHVEQVLRLAKLGAYDTTYVYRVSRGRYVQLTSVRGRREPMSGEQAAALRRLPLEAGLKHERGSLSMSHLLDQLDSAESSFSIMLSPAPHLDGRYTVFGKVEDGWETLDAIEAADLGGDGKPLHRLEITRCLVVPPERLAERPRGRPWRRRDPWTQTAVQLLLAAVVCLGLGGRFWPTAGAGRSAAALASMLASVALVASSVPGSGWAQVLALGAVGAAAWAMRGLDLAGELAVRRAAPAPDPVPVAPTPPPENPFWRGP